MGLLTGGWLASALGFRYNSCFCFYFLVPAVSVLMCFVFSVPTVSVLMCFVFSVPTVSVLMCFVFSVPTVSVLMCFVFSVLQYLSSYSILSMNLLFFVPTVTVLVHEFVILCSYSHCSCP